MLKFLNPKYWIYCWKMESDAKYRKDIIKAFNLKYSSPHNTKESEE